MPKKGDKKMKTAFIRVSAENNTAQNGLISYNFSDILQVLKEWGESCRFLYYAIEHNGEPGDENKHYHIVLNFGSTPAHFSTIKNKFPYGKIEPARSIKNCVQYLVHLNDLSKRAYEWDAVATNDPAIEKYKVMPHQTLDLKTKQYIDRIMSGEIREYNFADSIEPEVFCKRKAHLLNALELYRMKVAQDKSRKIEVYVLQGGTGTGKTTFVKNLCEKRGLSLCISSGSNDPWQDYKGEDVMLLDELRSDVFSLADLLKILDNHTKSTSRSRYSNKLFLGRFVFITTNEEWQDWYKFAERESVLALMRRAKHLYRFTRLAEQYTSRVEIFEWDDDKLKYDYKGTQRFAYAHLISGTQTDELDIAGMFAAE